MTKRILYVGTVAVTRIQEKYPDDHVSRYKNSIISAEYCTRFAADSWVEATMHSLKVAFDPTQWQDGIVRVDARVDEYIFDPEELNEYKPDFEVEFEVTITKRITTTVSAETCAELGHAEDEYGAEAAVEEMFDNGDLDDEIEAECEWDREISLLSVTEV
jgi:hypothetical protein